MSDLKVKKKVVVKKKYGVNNKEKVGITYEELLKLRQWVLTGSFTNELISSQNSIDLSQFHLVRRAAYNDPVQLNKILLDYSKITTKRETLFIILVLLSSGSFQSKKCFKESFNKIILSPNDLYRFFSIVKRYRGLGSVIHNAVKTWFKQNDVRTLEKMFVNERAKYNWCGQDILRLIKPKPRNKEEGLLFKYLTKDCIDFVDQQDYFIKLPNVWCYEQLRRETNTESAVSFIEDLLINEKAIPSNVHRTGRLKAHVLEQKTIEELIFYSKNRLSDGEVTSALEKRLEEFQKSGAAINIDLVDLISIEQEMISKIPSRSSILSLMDSLIANNIKRTVRSDNSNLHIIDMNNYMFNKLNGFYQITPAVIASVVSSKSSNVYTFSGRKKENLTSREVLEAEGRIEDSHSINIDKIREDYVSEPHTVYVWTDKEHLQEVERSMKILKKIYKTSNICLMNMSSAKLKTKGHDYYVINGYNYNTKKLMKLVERGMKI